jgi:predicted MFS family arabinose efflux permease
MGRAPTAKFCPRPRASVDTAPMRRVLELPVYRRLLAAYTLNELAWSIGSVVLSLLVYRRTGSAVAAAGFFLCSQFGPALISPLFVARLDQRSARLVLTALYALEAVAFLALAWVAGRFALAPVLVLTFLDGIISLTARALARATTVRVTAAEGLLREGNAVTNASFSLSFMVGPALGGVLVAVGGTVAALLVNGGLFAVVALTLVTATLPRPAVSRESTGGRVRAALAHAREEPVIGRLLGLQAAAVLAFTISIPVEVVFAQRSLHAGAGGYGALLSAWGLGAVAGSAIYARWRGHPSRELMSIGALALGVGFLVMAIAPSLAVAIVGSAVAGTGNGVQAVAARTALQEAVEERWMALMMSLNEFNFQAVPGLGILLGGAIAALAGSRVALAVGGAASLAVAVAVWIALRGAGVRESSDATSRLETATSGEPLEVAERN